MAYFAGFANDFARQKYPKSAKKCEMTSFCMTSLQIGLNEAAKYVDIIPIPLTLLASLLRLRTLVQNGKRRPYVALLRRLIVEFFKFRGMKTWKELTTGVHSSW